MQSRDYGIELCSNTDVRPDCLQHRFHVPHRLWERPRPYPVSSNHLQKLLSWESLMPAAARKEPSRAHYATRQVASGAKSVPCNEDEIPVRIQGRRPRIPESRRVGRQANFLLGGCQEALGAAFLQFPVFGWLLHAPPCLF